MRRVKITWHGSWFQPASPTRLSAEKQKLCEPDIFLEIPVHFGRCPLKASGLSATNIVRLKVGWEADYKATRVWAYNPYQVKMPKSVQGCGCSGGSLGMMKTEVWAYNP
jgi:hypothetical protein